MEENQTEERRPTLAEKEAEIRILKQKEAEEIISEIKKILASKNANIVPIVQIVGDRISYDWSIAIP